MSSRAASWLLLVGGVSALNLASEGPKHELDVPVCGMAYNGTSWSLSCDVDGARKSWPSPCKGGGAKVPWSETDGCKIAPPTGYKWNSQQHEDIDLYNNYFCNRKGGTFAEIGALDGERWSNTKFFEESMGWSGLLIEAAPSSASKLKVNRKNEANLILAEGVCQEEQKNMSFLVSGNPDVNGDPKDMSESFHNQWHSGGGDETITVPCRPLSTMLKEFLNRSSATHIDFFSLDVEGGELSVLSTFDFSVPVHMWVIELDGHNPGKDESVRQLLLKHNYTKSKKTFAGKSNEVWVMPQFV